MIIDSFSAGDIEPFLKLATTENWVAEPWEFEFLLSEFPRGCFAARERNWETSGFVTSLRHERSGWIGNLIVAGSFRGRGIGESLFKRAVEALQAEGVETIWLTASKSGAALYEKHGFTSIDTIIRWVGSGRRGGAADSVSNYCDVMATPSLDLDTRAWGDRRTSLLGVTARRGRLVQDESGFIVCQPYGDALQLGPFSASDRERAALLFENAVNSVPFGAKILVDTPASNRAALQLFNRNRMRIVGSNLLMYAGIKPDYRPELIYGLATMGSCG